MIHSVPEDTAFPCPEGGPGLTVREYLAAAALTGLLAFSDRDSVQYTPEQAAEEAFAYADALLKEAAKAPE